MFGLIHDLKFLKKVKKMQRILKKDDYMAIEKTPLMENFINDLKIIINEA